MTNLEWLKKRINEMSAEEIGKAWANEENPLWCDERCIADNCIDCVKKWATQPHITPMPELKVGMFVKADNGFETHLGIVINNIYTDNLAVAYESGAYDPMEVVTIEAIYSTVGFKFCDDDTCIWRRD